MNKFWNWIRDATDGRVLRFEGPIDSEAFWGDEVTPDMFRSELEAEEGDVTVWLNSPGGNVFAAAEIYTMLRDYKGAVTVKIASIAASAASVVAMAGDRVLMSPTALLMIHDPATIVMGDTRAMEHAIATLNEVKESIINAYAAKTRLRRSKIADLMAAETWINARKAVELGFADEILFDKPEPDEESEEEETPEDSEETPEDDERNHKDDAPSAQLYQKRTAVAAMLNSICTNWTDHTTVRIEPGLNRTMEYRPEITRIEPEDTLRNTPIIGMDGKTEDGAVPYEILRNQLEFLK